MPVEGEYAPGTSAFSRDQVEAYEASAGQEANTLADTGLPIIVVATRGRRTGKVRKFALMRVEHDHCYALVASLGGAPQQPQWYYNLLASPNEVAIQDGAAPFDVAVHLAEGEEYAAWWQRAVEAYASYADYQAMTSRPIPIFVAEPAPTR